jgi:hypothetical protein
MKKNRGLKSHATVPFRVSHYVTMLPVLPDFFAQIYFAFLFANLHQFMHI